MHTLPIVQNSGKRVCCGVYKSLLEWCIHMISRRQGRTLVVPQYLVLPPPNTNHRLQFIRLRVPLRPQPSPPPAPLSMTNVRYLFSLLPLAFLFCSAKVVVITSAVGEILAMDSRCASVCNVKLLSC